MSKNLPAVVRDNVVRLLGASHPKERGLLAKVIALGFGNGTAQAILAAERDLGLGRIEELASALSVEPWQLIFPGLDPDNLPRGEPYAFRWPFQRVAPEALLGLSGSAAQGIENGLLASLATLGLDPRPAAAPGLLERAIGLPLPERPPGRAPITAAAAPEPRATAAPAAPRKRTAKAPTGA